MLDSLIKARDKWLKPDVGLMFPSHTTMYLAPIADEQERLACRGEMSGAMGDWINFVRSTQETYGVSMDCLTNNFERESKEYYMLSSRWSELMPEAVLAEPVPLKVFDMATCTLEESKGFLPGQGIKFEFEVDGDSSTRKQSVGAMDDGGKGDRGQQSTHPAVISGFAGWFTADFKSRTDPAGKDLAPKLKNPILLTTGPEGGYTHWGQQSFFLDAQIPLIAGEVTTVGGNIELARSEDNARMYNAKITHKTERKNKNSGVKLYESSDKVTIWQIP